MNSPVTLPEDPHQIVVDVWSDVVCPWCAIGKARLQTAAAALAAEGRPVRLRWRPQELPQRPPASDAATKGLQT